MGWQTKLLSQWGGGVIGVAATVAFAALWREGTLTALGVLALLAGTVALVADWAGRATLSFALIICGALVLCAPALANVSFLGYGGDRIALISAVPFLLFVAWRLGRRDAAEGLARVQSALIVSHGRSGIFQVLLYSAALLVGLLSYRSGLDAVGTICSAGIVILGASCSPLVRTMSDWSISHLHFSALLSPRSPWR